MTTQRTERVHLLRRRKHYILLFYPGRLLLLLPFDVGYGCIIFLSYTHSLNTPREIV